jgi:hypothetical protein
MPDVDIPIRTSARRRSEGGRRPVHRRRGGLGAYDAYLLMTDVLVTMLLPQIRR